MKPHINITNEIGQRHGLWIHYRYNGNLGYKGKYINDLNYGYWIDNYYITAPKSIITFYLK